MSKLRLVRDAWSLDEIKNIFHCLSLKIHLNPKLVPWMLSDKRIQNFSDVSWPRMWNKAMLQTWCGKPWTIVVDPHWESLLACVTNYFTEHVRVNARRIGHKSIAEKFHMSDWRRHYIAKITTYSSAQERYSAQQESIAIALRYQVCETFPWSVGFALYNLFKPKSVLDMCAGWGDRMLSAAACGIETYLGVDPNPELANPYLDMISELGLKDSHNFRVVTKPFEDMGPKDFKDSMYDMMFSCPPYYNAEIYSSTDENQSSARYAPKVGTAGIDDWLNGFMLPSIEIAWSRLKQGGIFVVVLNDNKDQHYTARVLDHIHAQAGADYLGMLKYTVSGTPVMQPIWIFRRGEMHTKTILEA
jgi:hypothetical protein